MSQHKSSCQLFGDMTRALPLSAPLRVGGAVRGICFCFLTSSWAFSLLRDAPTQKPPTLVWGPLFLPPLTQCHWASYFPASGIPSPHPAWDVLRLCSLLINVFCPQHSKLLCLVPCPLRELLSLACLLFGVHGHTFISYPSPEAERTTLTPQKITLREGAESLKLES